MQELHWKVDFLAKAAHLCVTLALYSVGFSVGLVREQTLCRSEMHQRKRKPLVTALLKKGAIKCYFLMLLESIF